MYPEAMRAIVPTAAPTPMPASVPVLRVGSVELGGNDGEDMVEIEDEVDTHGFVLVIGPGVLLKGRDLDEVVVTVEYPGPTAPPMVVMFSKPPR